MADLFKKLDSIQEVNALAASLKQLGMREKLEELAKKHQVMKAELEDYLIGKRYFFLDCGETIKSFDTARAKVMDEMFTLNEPHFGDIIGKFLLSCCNDEVFGSLILQKHKTLQRCIEYVMERAYGMVSEAQKERRTNVGLALTSDIVFGWVKDYYMLDDKADMENKEKEAEERFQNRLKLETTKKSAGKSSAKGKRSKKEKKTAEKSSDNTEVGKLDGKSEKAQVKGQFSLFELPPDMQEGA